MTNQSEFIMHSLSQAKQSTKLHPDPIKIKNSPHKNQSFSTYPARDYNSSDDRNQRKVSEPGLSLHRHQVSKHRSKEGRRRPHRLIERDWQVPQRDVPTDDRSTEDETQSGDLEELDPRSDGLHGHELHPCDRDVAQQRASSHVAHSEEDWVLEPIIAQQVLVEEEDADVGVVPGRNEADREESAC